MAWWVALSAGDEQLHVSPMQGGFSHAAYHMLMKLFPLFLYNDYNSLNAP